MPIPRNDANERSERIFHPKPSPAPLGGAFICAAFLLAVLAIPFLGETLSGEDYLIVIGGSILFSFLTFLFLKTHHLSKTVYKCDVVGVGAVNGDKEKFVAWSDIAAIDCSHSLGGSGELRVDLLDANKRKLVSIKTEHLPRGGRDMLDYLHHRLAPLFDAKADCYLKGDDHWAFSVIRDVVKIEERNLLVEYPKNKKLIIPFSELRRVEWLPGVISGGKAGHVIIDHQEGSLELPQMIKGMQYFIYALKCRCGLSCVNPERPPEVTEKLDELRRKSGRRKLGLLAGAMLFLGMFLPMGIIVWEWIKDSQTKTIGKSVQAVVTEKKSNEVVVLEYTDPQGKHRENDARVEKNFYDTIKTGAKLTIKVHPFFGAQIDFKEKTPMNMTTLLTLFVICAVLSFIGLSIFILSLRGSGKMKLEIAELDAVRLKPEEPVPPSEGSASNGPPPLPTANITAPASCQALKSESAAALVEPTPDKENAGQEKVESPAIDDPNNEPVSASGKSDPGEISTAPAAFQSEIKTCASCGNSIEEEYFLAAGAPWCRDCRGKRVDSATKPGCLILLRILVFGLTAAFLGGGLWALIVIVTGYELGLVAVLVGLLVGYSV
ncbi:MAG: hypothetical protein GXP32_09960, partial [Kiritimatiellaeota bacterium]|nr:hypothetical protein [Kiritimatiellota bacterium]